MEIWHDKFPFRDSEHWKKELCRFMNFYNTVKLQKSLHLLRSYRLIFLNLLCKQRCVSL